MSQQVRVEVRDAWRYGGGERGFVLIEVPPALAQNLAKKFLPGTSISLDVVVPDDIAGSNPLTLSTKEKNNEEEDRSTRPCSFGPHIRYRGVQPERGRRGVDDADGSAADSPGD